MDSALVKEIITRTAETIYANTNHLTALDQAIGDGDHGVNISRGFVALEEKKSMIAKLPFSEACKETGMTFVMSVGGASGPLFGSCIMSFGDKLQCFPVSQSEAAIMLRGGVEAVKKRGKSDVGAKTMLDVLIPLVHSLEQTPDISFSGIREVVRKSAQHTKDMIATKGRAAFLGERSIGHVDPGAKSVSLIVETICDILEKRQ